MLEPAIKEVGVLSTIASGPSFEDFKLRLDSVSDIDWPPTMNATRMNAILVYFIMISDIGRFKNGALGNGH